MDQLAQSENPKCLKLNYIYKFWTDVEQVDVENEVSKEYT